MRDEERTRKNHRIELIRELLLFSNSRPMPDGLVTTERFASSNASKVMFVMNSGARRRKKKQAKRKHTCQMPIRNVYWCTSVVVVRRESHSISLFLFLNGRGETCQQKLYENDTMRGIRLCTAYNVRIVGIHYTACWNIMSMISRTLMILIHHYYYYYFSY